MTPTKTVNEYGQTIWIDSNGNQIYGYSGNDAPVWNGKSWSAPAPASTPVASSGSNPWSTWNVGNYQANLDPGLIALTSAPDTMQGLMRSPGTAYSPDGRYMIGVGDDGHGKYYSVYDTTQGAGEPIYQYDANGKFQGTRAGAKIIGQLKGALMVAGAAAGMGAIGGATAGGAGAAAGGGGGTVGVTGANGAFLGEGVASGVGAWDGALASAGAGAAGGAGVTGFGDAGTMYGGADAGSAGSLGGGYSVNGGSALGGSTAMGAGGAGGAGGGTPPPANPYAAGAGGSGFGGAGMSGFSWTDLIGPATQLFGGYMNAQAAGDASNAQLQAAREAAARFEPWTQAGGWSIGQAANMLGKNGPAAATAAFQQDPGYQWRIKQGENALTRAASARGLMGSGKFLKDAMDYNQGQASQEYSNSLNRLLAVAGMGQTATNSAADYGTQGANAQAAGIVGRANAYNNALTQGYGMYQQNRFMNGLGY